MARPTFFSLAAPVRAVMRRLTLRDKLALVAVIALSPPILVAWITLSKVQQDLAFTRHELVGIGAVDAVLALTGQVEAHRHHAHLAASGDAEAFDALARVRGGLPAAMDRVASALPAAQRAAFTPIREGLQALATAPVPAPDAPAGTGLFGRHAPPISALRMLILDVAEHSGLSLDPEGATHFLMDLTVERHVPWSDALSSARTLAMGRAARGDAAGRDGTDIAEQLRRLEDRLVLASRSAAAVVRAGGQPPASLETARQATERFVQAALAAFAADAPADPGTAWIQAGDEALAAIEPFGHAALAALQAHLLARADALEQQRWIVAGVSIAAMLLLACLLSDLYTAIVGTMRAMHRAVTETAAGNLVPSAAIRGSDEFARTGEQLEKMNAELSILIAGVRSNAVVVSNIGATLARGNADLSSQAEQQAGSLQATTQSLQVINETAARTAESVRAVDAHADRMRQTAEAGGAAMREAVEAIGAVEQSAAKIRDIIGLINGIAFQTNILALNAAVEAARAGEHGRGFAVVATEVRTLAQRSATAAGEIQGLVQRTAASVQLCSDRIAAVHGRLDEIVDGARGLADNTRTISTAAGEESESLRRIAQTMSELDALTQRTSQMADSARQASTELQSRASQLNRALGIFRLRQGCADEAIALVERALPVAARGSEAGLARITGDASLRDRDMYVFVFDRQGIYRAVAGNASRVGVALSSIPGLDARKLVDDAFSVTERGGGWVDYRIDNPATGRTEPKTSYVVPLTPGLVLGCGIYRTEIAEA